MNPIYFIYFIYAFLGLYTCIGLATLGFGYKLLRPLITFYGVFLGAAIGFAVASALASEHWVLQIVGAALGAAALGFLFFYIYKVFLFLYAALIGAGVSAQLLTEHLPEPALILASLVAAVISGFLLLKFLRPVVIVISSISGALITGQVVMILLMFFQREAPDFVDGDALRTFAILPTIWLFLGLFAAGVLFQFMTTRNGDLPQYKSSRRKKVNTAEYSSPYAFLHEKGSK
ncbi:MAG: hypothetical protein JJU29_18925 [Verrucomicrobia bacterium]|nr:hypothetical protein [Verrucomicrobiota bacterium]MCH8514128.1 hypothetical protein [Kiritimatiellia bacterium]